MCCEMTETLTTYFGTDQRDLQAFKKAGLIVFGIFFIIGAISVASVVKFADPSTYIAGVAASLALVAGIKIFSNAFRRRAK